MKAKDDQLVAIISEHSRKLERIETLPNGSGAGGDLHHTLVAFMPGVSVATFGRMRLLPGAGKRYRVISWAIACNAGGSVVIDLLKGAGYPPATSMCPGARPSCVGPNHSVGTAAGWATDIINHGEWLILNVFSYSLVGQVGFSMELQPEVI
jgi:hypothetical protein